MASSVQIFKGRHVILNDLDLLVVVVVSLKSISESKKWFDLRFLFDEWKNTLKSYGPGVIDLKLDALAGSEENRCLLLNLLENEKVELLSYGDLVPADILNKPGYICGVTFKNYRVNEIIFAIDSLINIIIDKPESAKREQD